MMIVFARQAYETEEDFPLVAINTQGGDHLLFQTIINKINFNKINLLFLTQFVIKWLQ